MMPAYTATHSSDAALLAEMDTVRASSPTIALHDQQAWKMRDMAREMASNRVVEYSSTQRQRPMPISSQFDFDLAIARIRRDKAAVVRSAFDAAATAVLEALARSHESETDNISVNEDDLPAILRDITKLEELRDASMDRAHDNKEYAKRKPGVTSGKQNHTGSLAEGGHTGGIGIASQKAGTTGSGKSKKSDSKAKSDTPKFTRNTPASSAVSTSKKRDKLSLIRKVYEYTNDFNASRFCLFVFSSAGCVGFTTYQLKGNFMHGCQRCL